MFPVFSTLRVNPQITHLMSDDKQLHELSSKIDLTLGTILQGLLLQRESFAEFMRSLVAKHPLIREDIQDIFL